jgi:phenylalanyl-tRNA synthetase beta chain
MATPLDFFDGKGVLEVLAREFGVRRFKVRAAEMPWLQPGRSAEVVAGGEVIGWLGEIHPAVLDRFECDGPVVPFEIDANRFMNAGSATELVEPPKHPPVELDMAIVVEEGVSAEKVEQSIRSAGGKLLDGVRLFDVYRGAGVDAGMKSMAFALTYRAPDRTLTAEEVETAHARLVRKVLASTGGTLRS